MPKKKNKFTHELIKETPKITQKHQSYVCNQQYVSRIKFPLNFLWGDQGLFMLATQLRNIFIRLFSTLQPDMFCWFNLTDIWRNIKWQNVKLWEKKLTVERNSIWNPEQYNYFQCQAVKNRNLLQLYHLKIKFSNTNSNSP
jgi:hypothetical protein